MGIQVISSSGLRIKDAASPANSGERKGCSPSVLWERGGWRERKRRSPSVKSDDMLMIQARVCSILECFWGQAMISTVTRGVPMGERRLAREEKAFTFSQE
ncbi:hypothetical protein AAC387_Pa11g0768 [Persea americana]